MEEHENRPRSSRNLVVRVSWVSWIIYSLRNKLLRKFLKKPYDHLLMILT